jgi:hypothetical protein
MVDVIVPPLPNVPPAPALFAPLLPALPAGVPLAFPKGSEARELSDPPLSAAHPAPLNAIQHTSQANERAVAPAPTNPCCITTYFLHPHTPRIVAGATVSVRPARCFEPKTSPGSTASADPACALLTTCARRRLRAAQLSAGTAASLFHRAQPYETSLQLSIGELRSTLGVPVDGLSAQPRQLHAHAPALAAPGT